MCTKLVTESEAADFLSLTPRQVLRLASRGELPHVAFPNKEVRFDPDDLARFVESYKRPAPLGVNAGDQESDWTQPIAEH
jgi:excisionase family DNA binding protein